MTPEVVDAVVAPLLPRLVSLLDDDSEDTRLITCRVVEQLLLTHCHKFVADFAGYDQLHSLYVVMLSDVTLTLNQHTRTTPQIVDFY